MNVDFGKRLCDATLGEYLAAERSVGIVTGWIMAIGTAGAILAWRFLWPKVRRLWRKPPPAVAAFVGIAGAAGVSWYYGDTGNCRRCGCSNVGAGQLARCPACGFEGGRP